MLRITIEMVPNGGMMNSTLQAVIDYQRRVIATHTQMLDRLIAIAEIEAERDESGVATSCPACTGNKGVHHITECEQIKAGDEQEKLIERYGDWRKGLALPCGVHQMPLSECAETNPWVLACRVETLRLTTEDKVLVDKSLLRLIDRQMNNAGINYVIKERISEILRETS